MNRAFPPLASGQGEITLKCLDITGDQFHPEWNYMITPGQQSKS
jgi:hypothetical protein